MWSLPSTFRPWALHLGRSLLPACFICLALCKEKNHGLLFNSLMILKSIFWNASTESRDFCGVEHSKIRNVPSLLSLLPFILSLALLPPAFPHPHLFLFHFPLDPSLSLLPTLLSLCGPLCYMRRWRGTLSKDPVQVVMSLSCAGNSSVSGIRRRTLSLKSGRSD